MQAGLQDLIGRSEVYNVGGGGGTNGLSQFEQFDGQPNQLMVMGLVMVGAIAANNSSVTLKDVTPIAQITTEPELIVVPTDSDPDLNDLIAALEQDLGTVSWAGGSAGGAEQILAGLIAQDLGARAGRRQLHRALRRRRGGRDPALRQRDDRRLGRLGVVAQIEAGKLRPIAVSSAERVESLPDTPTLMRPASTSS